MKFPEISPDLLIMITIVILFFIILAFVRFVTLLIKKIFNYSDYEFLIFENDSLVYCRSNNLNKIIVKNYPYLEEFKENSATKYIWSDYGFEELGRFIKSVSKELNNDFSLFRRKTFCLFPNDIFESERVFLRNLVLGFCYTSDIYMVDYRICLMHTFPPNKHVGKKILYLGERVNILFSENGKPKIDYKKFSLIDEEIYGLDLDLIICNADIEQSKFKCKLFLKGEELRHNLIYGCMEYLKFHKI